MPVRMQNLVALTALAIGAMVATTAHAQKKYDSGATRHRNQDRQHHAL